MTKDGLKVGFIGLGIMGTPMCGHLITAGHRLFVHTRSQVPAEIADLETRQCPLDLEACACRGVDEQRRAGVLALGGGSVMRSETQERLRGHRVVWLRVSVSDAANRVGMNTARVCSNSSSIPALPAPLVDW